MPSVLWDEVNEQSRDRAISDTETEERWTVDRGKRMCACVATILLVGSNDDEGVLVVAAVVVVGVYGGGE